MSLTWTQPTTGANFGPGFLIVVSTDFIGPIATGSHWDISLYEHTTETFISAMPPRPTTSHSLTMTYGVSQTSQLINNPLFSNIHAGSSLEIRAALVAPDFSTIDSGTQTVTANFTDGLPYLLSILQSSIGSTAPLAADLADIKTATFATFAGGVTTPISQLIQAPPMGFLSRELITPDRTGEGSLTRPTGPVGVDAFGMAWEVVDSAPGIGISEGAPDTLETHMLDLELVHQLHDGNYEDTARERFNFGDALWMFPVGFPSSVSYWIGPGVTLRFYWLIISL